MNEGEERFTITLGGTSLANASVNTSAATGAVVITDNDPQPALTIADGAEQEGTAITFNPTLDAVSGRMLL